MEDVTQENQRITNTRADQLNRQCYCVTLDRKALNESLRNQFVDAGNEASAAPELDHLFSNTPVFVPQADIETMERIVQAIESAVEASVVSGARPVLSCPGRRKSHVSIQVPWGPSWAMTFTWAQTVLS